MFLIPLQNNIKYTYVLQCQSSEYYYGMNETFFFIHVNCYLSFSFFIALQHVVIKTNFTSSPEYNETTKLKDHVTIPPFGFN